MAKASDNVYPKLIVSEQTTPASPAAGQQKLYLDSADHKLKRVNSSGSVTTIEGGGNGGGIRDRRWAIGAGELVIDEFNDDSLAAGWIRVDGTGAAAGNVTYDEAADTLSARNVGGDTASKLHGLVTPLSGFGGSVAVGDAFVSCVSVLTPPVNYAYAGLVLSDGATHGSGNQVWLSVGRSAAAAFQVQPFGWTNWGTDGTSATGFLWDKSMPHAVYVRLVCTAANTWRGDISLDGHLWMTDPTTVSKAITPTHVGFACTSYGSTTKHIASYEFLRRVSGVS